MNILFKEKQRVDSLWPLSITAVVLAMNWFLYFRMGYNDMIFFYICMIIVGSMSLFLSMLRLETEINDKSINYKFYPFYRKWQTIPLSQIAKAEVRQYNAYKEFGGRGNRHKKNINALTLNGNQGIELFLKSKKIILIGTKKPDEIKQAITILKL